MTWEKCASKHDNNANKLDLPYSVVYTDLRLSADVVYKEITRLPNAKFQLKFFAFIQLPPLYL